MEPFLAPSVGEVGGFGGLEFSGLRARAESRESSGSAEKTRVLDMGLPFDR